MADAAISNVQASAKAQWIRHIAVFAVLLVLAGFFYWPAISAALTVYWVSPTYSHCYLIAPISAWLVWNKRAELSVVRPTLYLPALVLMIPLAIVWFLGHLMAINEAQQFMLIAMVQVLILALFGRQVYRILMFPALFLFFLVPTGEYLIGPLQRFTTH
ncbi:MAG TPA: archaeosortase/exosortase family protein, partial [Rhizomicrobium sp.]